MSTRKTKHSRETPEWYTPPQYADAARNVMGGIELDPASCAIANQYIKADRYYTKEMRGDLQQWIAASVYINPPGSASGRSGQETWFKYAVSEYNAGNAAQVIFCVFNSSGTETHWFQNALGNYPICFPKGRIKFIAPDGKLSRPVHGNAFIYMGQNTDKFITHFSQFGKVIPAWLRS